MTIERLTQLVTRRFGGVGATRGSIVRIHAWIIACLVLVSALAPAHGSGATYRRFFGPVQGVFRNPNDNRAYYPSAFSRKKYFHIAWIMGSEGDVYPPGEGTHHLATQVRTALPEIDHRPVVVDLYYLGGMRVVDDYLSLLDAIAAKPDLIVMSLNPVLLFNPFPAQEWTLLDVRGAVALANKPKEWPIAASLFSPSDLMWGVAQSRLKVIAERNYWSKRVHDLVDDLGPLDRSKLAAATTAQKPDRTAQELAKQPAEFWFDARLHRPEPGAPRPSDAQIWANLISTSTHEAHPLNTMLLRAIGTALRATKIPSYVYLAQANWLSTSPEMSRAVAGVEQRLAALRGSFSSRHIRFEPTAASRLVKGIRFRPHDVVHMNHAGGFGPYFARELCLLEAQAGRGVACTPTAEAAGND